MFAIILIICSPNLSNSFHHNMKYSMNVVKTKYGPIRGVIVRSEPLVEAYLGVPYASPPVGSLRFMPPVTPSTWKNVRLADRFSPVCPQSVPIPPNGPEALLEVPRGRLAQLRRLLPLLANQSEDCLYLNLYVPRAFNPGSASPPSPTNYGGDAGLNAGPQKSDATAGSNAFTNNNNNGFSELNDDPRRKSLPTIVYVHGESYEWNSGNPYDGSVLAAHGNVIIVTVNFRLGILGFLKTGGKGSAQGNFGLMDLVAALHWLRENLPAFGGDPNKVTIMGHGTGAALANILIVSPVASDLVHRAILLSGSALSPWAIQKDPIFVKRRVAEQTGCHGDLLLDDLAPCLRTKPIEQLLQVKIDSPRFLPGFAPFIDGTVISHASGGTSGPLTLPVGSAIASTSGIELADFPTRELIFGLTTIESYLDLSAQDLEFGFNETRRDRILRTYVRNVYHYHLNEIYAALKNEYTDWERPVRNPLGSRDASLEFLSDGHTAAPLIRLGYLHSLRGGRTYFIHFRHQSGERDFPQRSGSVRGEDVPFSLGLPISPLFPYNYTKQDIKISRIMLRYLSNFAQSGNPNETPATSVDISHLVHNKSPLTSSSLTLDSSVVPPSSSSRTFDDKQKLHTETIYQSANNNNNENVVVETATVTPSSSPTSSSNSLQFIREDKKLQKINSNSETNSDTNSSPPTSSLVSVRSSSSTSVLLSSLPSAITSLSTHNIMTSRTAAESSSNGNNNNNDDDDDDDISNAAAAVGVIEPTSLRAINSFSKTKKSKRHIVTLSSFSYASTTNMDDDDNDGIAPAAAGSSMTRRSFKRRKRKAIKHSKRKNISIYSTSDGKNGNDGETKTASNSKITGINNNNSIFYRKRYSLPLKSLSTATTTTITGNHDLNHHHLQQDKQLENFVKFNHRHKMQNDQQHLDNNDDNDDDDIDNEEDENDTGIDDEDEDDEGDDDEEFDRGDGDGAGSNNQRLDSRDEDEIREKFDRFTDDISFNRLPFWDTYDAINQLYLDLGSKVEIRNHYRGHKLSMWLSLIPQLHSPGDLNELPMRHHHFPEDSAQYYDGIIRPQIMQRPNFPKSNVHQQQPQSIGGSVIAGGAAAITTTTTTTATTTSSQRIDLAAGINAGNMPTLTTECPPNTTIVPTIAATRPQNQQNTVTGGGNTSHGGAASKTSNSNHQTTDNNLLRRLASSQYQSYTTALLVTISVGCFLLLLNILIFAGIYYQREKRLTDAKKKEELRDEAERCGGGGGIGGGDGSTPNLEKLGRAGGSSLNKIGSRKSSLQSLTGYNSSGSFGEYSCYDEKLQCKEKHALADICSVELPLKEFKSSTSPNASNTGSLRRNTTISPQQQQNQSGLLIYPPSYHNNSNSSNIPPTHKHFQHTATKQLQYSSAGGVENQQGCSTSTGAATTTAISTLNTSSNNATNTNGLVTYSQFHRQAHQQQQHVHHQHHLHHSQVSNPLQQQQQQATTTVGTSTEQCNQSTQSDQPNVQDVGTSADEKTVIVMVSGTPSTGLSCSSPGTATSGAASGLLSTTLGTQTRKTKCNDDDDDGDNDDDMISPGIPEPPPPPKSSAPYQGGILRQPGPPTTPGSNKKRVQIQEISV